MRPVLHENMRGGGVFQGQKNKNKNKKEKLKKKNGYFMAKKDTLTLIHFGMNAAVWVKQ